MNKIFDYTVKNWKSTLSGTLTVTLVTTGYLLTQPITAAHHTLTGVLTIVQGLAKIYIALIQKDS